MDFSFTEEQLMIQDVARRIAQERIAPSAEHHDRTGEFPLENIRLLGENGLMGIEVPEEYGGAGMDPIAYVLAMVEIAAGDAAHSTIVSVNNSLFCAGILKNGDEAQKQKYVRAIADGSHIGAFALTEPQSGSDATAMRCRAVRQDDGSFVINGKKSWITSGPVAKYLVLFAVTDPEQGSRGITAFVIDTDKPGFHRGKTEPKLGIRASATCEIEFQDYVASADEVLGVPGEGFKIAMSVLDAGRIGIASQAIGIARAAYQATLDYVKERKAFGSPIGAFQMTQAKIADMKCKLDASLLLTLRAAWVKGQGQRFTTEAAVAKLTASEAAMWITHQAVQIHGGMGYSKEMPLERYFRDAKITEIYEGTSEIQRLVIARNETGLR
ncbi:acyl-CoA dehydrogenase family protein [Xanthomonas translucens]|uniref:3-sulfinopropanoyl-CoA desulfinase n=1 Tax=Xanthomonas campestris pv. translucens TaxID=343 RepID=A0A109HL88_XANCT|nr:acyl-CoA dehydrogenase family protein [Xanthomonas translucens]UKE60073.1 acyl-CoA dehydrogenase family protein [Xanthomonas translucens pv. hordei]KTF41417.1 acyl-CoA dehydrogenase [Xanthomonas translucens pv. translucens]KWV14220.1 acyl-CoA dehydrogenase [Xanthomonas translucens]KWV15047.1 acyl-CoA dehydrogenase [Xanthomonas translucens]MCS3360769.1 acyl-CoA dehydrogenase family protein [Xanthomonas translucens pv. translucens]